jgi:hypothetical protein
MRPPAIAPGIEPIPPITAAVKPLRPARKPIDAAVGTRRANMTPAAPARAEPSTKVKTITRSMLMPIIAAASRSNDTARIALPVRVRLTSTQSTAISARAVRIVMMRISGMCTLLISKPRR